MIKIAPSILSADFSNLADEIKKVVVAGADMIHIDIMDGHFVPNLTFGAPVVAGLRKVTDSIFDVHLMVTNPQDYVIPFARAGADLLTFHVETAPHMHRIIQSIKENNMKVGIALNPGTSLSTIEEVLDEVDMILLMTVNPGFGGQKFITNVLDKIDKLKKMLSDRQLVIDIQVDGGINEVTAKQVIQKGANILVAGSAVYGSNDIAKTIKELKLKQKQ
ncbi:MAG: ribulose-phosphate 3-epimerase [Firmicutes bacterium]|nr:ribulose-phosphate 3-epimerase [Bacillota bacterium]